MNINKFLFHSVNETEEMNKELNINLKTIFFVKNFRSQITTTVAIHCLHKISTFRAIGQKHTKLVEIFVQNSGFSFLLFTVSCMSGEWQTNSIMQWTTSENFMK